MTVNTTPIRTPLGRSAWRIGERKVLAQEALSAARKPAEIQHWQASVAAFDAALKILEEEAARG